MSTLEERKQKLNKRLAEIDKTYTDNEKQATLSHEEAQREAIRILQSRDLFGKNKEKRLVLIDKLNDAEMTMFVNREFSFILSMISDIANYLLDVANDVEKNMGQQAKHGEFFHTILETLDNVKKQNEAEQLRKEQDQKRIKELTGIVYG